MEMKINKGRFIFFALYGLLVTSAMGTIVGTYAWYQYSARASMMYHGTAINNPDSLAIGLFSSVKLEDAASLELIPDENVENLYWTSNGISKTIMSYFARENGYAYNQIAPTTSSAYSRGDELKLRSAPSEAEIFNPNYLAKKEHYCYIPLAFKCNGLSENQLYLTEAELESEGSLYQGVRIYIDNGEDKFIFNPTSPNDGYTEVGGPLDMDRDGYLDVNNSDKKEYIYGEYDDVIYNDELSPYIEPLPYEERTTFNGRHLENSYACDTLNSKFKTADYLGQINVLSNIGLGYEFIEGIYRINLTVYLEGWSTSVIDEEIGNYFSLDMKFMMES